MTAHCGGRSGNEYVVHWYRMQSRWWPGSPSQISSGISPTTPSVGRTTTGSPVAAAISRGGASRMKASLAKMFFTPASVRPPNPFPLERCSISWSTCGNLSANRPFASSNAPSTASSYFMSLAQSASSSLTIFA